MAGVTIGPDGSMNWVGEPAVKKPRKSSTKQSNFEWYGDDVMREVQKRLPWAVREAAQIVQDSAQALAPVDDGALRTSIVVEQINEHSAKVGPSIFYDVYVEYGTGIHAKGKSGAKKIPWAYKHPKYGWITTKGNVAQPYMRPAADKNRQKVADVLKVAIGQAVTAGAK